MTPVLIHQARYGTMHDLGKRQSVNTNLGRARSEIAGPGRPQALQSRINLFNSPGGCSCVPLHDVMKRPSARGRCTPRPLPCPDKRGIGGASPSRQNTDHMIGRGLRPWKLGKKKFINQLQHIPLVANVPPVYYRDLVTQLILIAIPSPGLNAQLIKILPAGKHGLASWPLILEPRLKGSTVLRT